MSTEENLLSPVQLWPHSVPFCWVSSQSVTCSIAAQLRPHDARFWCAMGQCYAHEQLGMDEAAIRCYQRAHDSDDREGAPCFSPQLTG